MFAKAMGAEVYAFTHSPNKVEEIKKLGADHVVITHDEVRPALPRSSKTTNGHLSLRRDGMSPSHKRSI